MGINFFGTPCIRKEIALTVLTVIAPLRTARHVVPRQMFTAAGVAVPWIFRLAVELIIMKKKKFKILAMSSNMTTMRNNEA